MTASAPHDESAGGLTDRFRGCLLGVAVGDALGAPFEGLREVDPAAVAAWADASARLEWTDDTHMTIGLGRALLERRGLDQAHLAATFARDWRAEPHRGYGPGPPRVFAALAGGATWQQAATALFDGRGSYGNGGAMRVAPVALAARRSRRAVVALARASAAVTHSHELGQQAAALQAAAIAWLLAADPAAEPTAAELVGAVRDAAPAAEFQRRLDAVARMTPRTPATDVVGAVGHGVAGHEAVPAALAAFARRPASLPGTVLGAIELGGDTDTIASMAGALSGAFLGATAIPAAWLDRLEQAAQLRRLADDLRDLDLSAAAGGQATDAQPGS